MKELMMIFIVLVVIFTVSSHVYACNCDVPDHAMEALDRSDAVFTGNVIDMKKTNIRGNMHDAVLIEVNRAWKGINETQAIVYTDWSSCMFEFTIGESYLLYATLHEDKLFVINCGRSSLLSQASSDIAELGEGREPSIHVHLTGQFISPIWKYTLLIIFLGSLIVLFAALGFGYYRVKNLK